MKNNSICYVAVFAFLCSICFCGSTKERQSIEPVRFSVSFSSKCSANAWIISINSKHKGDSYELALLPEYDVNKHLLGWTIWYYNLEDRNQNLLEPEGNWHGILPIDLMAADFKAGFEKSVFGATRKITIKKKWLLTVVITDSIVVEETPGRWSFERLDITLSLENI